MATDQEHDGPEIGHVIPQPHVYLKRVESVRQCGRANRLGDDSTAGIGHGDAIRHGDTEVGRVASVDSGLKLARNLSEVGSHPTGDVRIAEGATKWNSTGSRQASERQVLKGKIIDKY